MSIKKSKLGLRKGLTVITSAATIMMLSGVALVPFGASADHTTEHTIEQLLVQIAALQAQLVALQAGTQAPSTSCNFTRSLFLGVSGEDVRCLQQYLNGAGHTVAASGAGSPGNETQFYGPLTQSAVASWQAANAVAPAVGYFGPISTAKYNSLVATGQVPGATPTPTGPLSVSLAPNNPGAQTITKNAYGETLMVLRFTGSGTVQELTFERKGAGATGDYDNLYIYDGARRLTGGRTPSSADGTVTFISLDVSVSGSKDLKLVADHSATAGNVNYWDLTKVTADSGTISGTPLRSNNFSVSGSDSGTLNVDKSGSVANPKVGQKNAELSEFKLTANTEAAFVKRVQLINGGDVATSNITNLRLEVQGQKVADGFMTNDDYAVFDFGEPGYKIEKGDNKVLHLFGDVGGKKDETVKFYVEETSDVTAVGDQFGFGMKPTIDGNFDDATNTHALTLQGGVLTLTFNGPNASNVGTDSQDTILARYTFSAANDIEVKKLGLVLCKDDTGNGTYDNAADTTDGWADIDDVKIVDEDTGQVVVGPSDGSGFKTSEATGCPDSKTGASKIFTDTFDLKAGTAKNLKVTGDIKTANSRSGVDLVSGDIIKVVLDGYGESDLSGTSGSTAVLKYSGTNTAVDDSDIVPNTDLAANNMTIQSSSLTLGLAGQPGDQTVVKGTKGVEAVGITFAAALASALEVTDITLTGYVADSGGTLAKGVGASPDGSLSVGNLVSAVSLWDGATGALISSTPSSNNLNNSTGTIAFTNLNWNIPSGETKTLLVKTDLSSNATSGSSDEFSFDIDATTDVTAVDNASKTVNAGNADPNGATAPTNQVTINDAGTIAITSAPATPITGAMYWGQTDAIFSVLRTRATNEAFYIERLNINSGDTKADVTANVDKVKVRYTNEAGSTLTAVGSLQSSEASVSFGFTGTSRPYVPKDSTMDITVMADLKTRSQRSGTALSTNGTEVTFSLDFSGGAADEFRAVGVGSGTLVEGNDTTDDDTNSVTANNQYVYRVYPEIVQDTLAASEPIGTKDALKFTIKAHGLTDSKILFDDPASVALKFEAVASGGASSNMTASLYDVSTGELLASATITAGQDDSSNSSISFTDWEKDVEIAGGSQKSFRVEVGFTNFLDKSDFFQVVLRDEANVITYVDGARTAEDNQVGNVANVFRLLPMNGSIFVKQ